MSEAELKRKNLILIAYLKTIYTDYKIKPEISTNADDIKVIAVQEVMGEKVVFGGNCRPLFDYFLFDIFGESIQEMKETALMLGQLIGQSIIYDYEFNDNGVIHNEKWQMIFKQFSNPQIIEYQDIRRVGYNLSLKCIINKVYEDVPN